MSWVNILKIKKSWTYEKGHGDEIIFTPNVYGSTNIKNPPKEWHRYYKKWDNKTQNYLDEQGRYNPIDETSEVEDLKVKGGFAYYNRGGYITDVGTRIEEITYTLNLNFEHDDWGDDKEGQDSRLEGQNYDPIDENIEVSIDADDISEARDEFIKGYDTDGRYQINVIEVDLVIDMKDSTDPKKWSHEVTLIWE